MKSINKLMLMVLLALSLHGCAGMPEYSPVYGGSSVDEEECCPNPLEGRRSSDTSARGIN